MVFLPLDHQSFIRTVGLVLGSAVNGDLDRMSKSRKCSKFDEIINVDSKLLIKYGNK